MRMNGAQKGTIGLAIDADVIGVATAARDKAQILGPRNRFADGAQCRLESIQNSTDQARCIAATIAGKPRPYTSVPWFWTDQFDQKLQIAGIPALAAEFVPRGDTAAGKFSVFGFRDGTLYSVESVNRPADHMLARKLLDTARDKLTPAHAADLTVDLKTLLR